MVKNNLVGGIPTNPSEKSWSSSGGMMKIPTEWKNKMFQTTNQIKYSGLFFCRITPQTHGQFWIPRANMYHGQNMVYGSWSSRHYYIIGESFHGYRKSTIYGEKKHALFFGLISSNFRPVCILVGGFNHLQKYWSMGRIIPYIMKKTCSKPPTNIYHHISGQIVIIH